MGNLIKKSKKKEAAAIERPKIKATKTTSYQKTL